MKSIDTSDLPKKGGLGLKAFLCLLCVGVNVLGAYAVHRFRLPLYLDTAGTIVAAVLGGSLPGMIVGMATNMLEGINDSSLLYYGVLNMGTAVLASFLAHKGVFRKNIKPLLTAPLFMLMTGVLSTVLSWFLNGAANGGKAGDLALQCNETLGTHPFLSQLLAEFALDIPDKLITMMLAVLLLRLLPDGMKKRLRWRNVYAFDEAEAPEDTEKKYNHVKCSGLSLRTKVTLILLAASALIAGTSTAISYVLFRETTINEHIKLADGLTQLAVEEINPVMVNQYIAKGENAVGYKETERSLYKLRASSPDVQYVYVYRIEGDGCHVVFDLDTEEVEGSEPGEVIPFEESFKPYLPDLLAGNEIDPIISNDSYGWLLTVYKPVRNESGQTQCYAAVDISMSLLSQFGYVFMAKLLSLFVGVFLLTLAFSMKLVEKNIINPVNAIAYCAGAFAYNSDKAREQSVERLKRLNVHSGDEVENLYNAFVQTTEESMRFVDDIQTQTETISQMQNGLIMVLADLVESRDKCTGDHVRKTAAYVKIICEEMKRRGFYKEQLTDKFIENVVNAAPLHDIGKINVPDSILNKPGKLTDLEFAIMKAHTTVGAEIMEDAIRRVPSSGYLEEAKDLAEFHHEKWNGKGYPHGLSGEEIPLSARIMAVADVFDALVSRRSYKKPFSFEKAMSIIKEDAGTHFDPLVAEAFLSAGDEVRKVAEEFDPLSNPDGGDVDKDGSTDQKRKSFANETTLK